MAPEECLRKDQMRVKSSDIAKYTTRDREIDIRRQGGTRFEQVTQGEALHLASLQMVECVVTREGRLKYLSSAVDEDQIRAALRACRRPDRSPCHVSRRIQARSSKTWVERLDNAKSGSIGIVRRIQTTVQGAEQFNDRLTQVNSMKDCQS
jgi:hypothetical protein